MKGLLPETEYPKMDPRTKAALPHDRPLVLAEWADTLTGDAQKTLERMDKLVTITENRLALIRRMLDRRRERTEMDYSDL